jgi:hypothetical protein
MKGRQKVLGVGTSGRRINKGEYGVFILYSYTKIEE